MAIIASISGVSTRPELVAEPPSTPCTKSGTNMIVPNIPMPVAKPARLATATVRMRNSSTGTIGCSTRRSHHRKIPSRTRPTANRRDDLRRRPRRLLAPADGGEQQRRQPGGEQRGARVVHFRAAVRVRRDLQRHGHHDERDHRDRQRDDEHPAPVGVVSDIATGGRPEDRCEAEHRPGQALPAPAVRRRHEVADRRDRERHERAGAEPLDGAGDDQLGHRRGGGADDAARGEQRDPGDEEPPAAVDVGQPAVDGRRDGGGEHVGAEHP